MANTCLTCRLPAAVRHDVADQHRRGVPLREISSSLDDRGHKVSRDAIHRHVTKCVAPPDDHDVSDDPAGLLVAVAASDVLAGWSTLATRLAERLMADGAVAAARIVLAATPEYLRPALEATEGTDAGELLDARALARACREVLSTGPSWVASAIAANLREQGAVELAEAFEDLAQLSRAEPK